MHTFKAHHGTKFHYNSDMSGDVKIVTENSELEIPGDDLLQFLVEHIKRLKVTHLKNALDSISWQAALRQITSPHRED